MGSRSTMFIGYSIVLHLFMSSWILGNNQIFVGESILETVNIDAVANLKIKDIMLKKHIVMLEIIAAMFLAHAVLKKSSARARGVIKGLASYNILQNPQYQDAFAITPEFAKNHNRLR